MKKTNNKGFSLVELIIVIAIMAILIGVLAPQYIKYVEKSRVSADKDLLDSIYNACTTAASDPEITASTIKTSAFDVSTLAGDGDATTFDSAVMDTLGQGLSGSGSAVTAKLKSKIGRGDGDIHVDVDANGNYTVYVGTKGDATGGITVGAGANN